MIILPVVSDSGTKCLFMSIFMFVLYLLSAEACAYGPQLRRSLNACVTLIAASIAVKYKLGQAKVRLSASRFDLHTLPVGQPRGAFSVDTLAELLAVFNP